MDHLDDLRCISAVLDGNADAFRAIVERYQKSIFNLMYRMTGSYADALDLAQEAFIKAYEHLHRFRQDRKFFPWLYTIAMNQAKNHLRSQNRVQQQTYIDEWEGSSGLDYPQQEEEILCSQLDAKVVHEAIMQLPVDYREAIVLRYREELTLEDVAEALQISLSGAKMRIHRGLKKLRDMLAADEERAAARFRGCHGKSA